MSIFATPVTSSFEFMHMTTFNAPTGLMQQYKIAIRYLVSFVLNYSNVIRSDPLSKFEKRVTWSSKTERSILLSTAESEWTALAKRIRHGNFLLGIVNELGVDQGCTPWFSDNQAAIINAKTPGYNGRARFVDVKLKFTRQECDSERVDLTYVAGTDHLADGFTKMLSGPGNQKFVAPMLHETDDGGVPNKPKERDEVWDIIRKELKGKNAKVYEPSEIFSEWDPPFGSSYLVRQVHRARLRNSGKEVVVKITYSKEETLARSHPPFSSRHENLCSREMQELMRDFSIKLDQTCCLQEAEALSKMHNVVLEGGFEKQFVIPHPIWEYTSNRILCMDYLPGETFSSVTRRYVKKIAQSKGMSNEEFMEDVIRTALDGGEGIGKDRYTGPSEFSIAMYCSALKAVDWCINLPHFFVNNFLWLFGYEKYSLPLMESEMPPNMPRIMDILFRFLIHSVVVGRYTNSDVNG